MEKSKETVDVAKFVISYYNNLGETISQLKLHKLLYYTQAWYLVNFEGEPIFSEEPEAWLNGPVYPSVYRAFPSKKSSPLRVSLFADAFQKPSEIFEKQQQLMNFTAREEKFMDAIFKKYGAMPDLLLVYSTHEEDPWLDARKGLPPFSRSNEKITLEAMRTYYKKRIES